MGTSFSFDDVFVHHNFFSEQEVNDFCDKQNTTSDEGWEDAGVISKGVSSYDPDFRKAKIKTPKIHKDNPFLVKLVYGAVVANESKFKQPIARYCGEGLNLLKYGNDNGRFKIHNDTISPEGTRALTTIILLSDPQDYEGGILYFYTDRPGNPGSRKFRNNIKKGTLVTFPSLMYHEVTPVTGGTRLSLVMWSHKERSNG